MAHGWQLARSVGCAAAVAVGAVMLTVPVRAATPGSEVAKADAASAAGDERAAFCRDSSRSAGPPSQSDRQSRIGAAKSWGYQLGELWPDTAARSPFDLLVVDATAGLAEDRIMTCDDVRTLQKKPDGSRRLVVSYLSIGEAEDYRPDYFDPNYLEEDAPDWLLRENPKWTGNRVVKFCAEGWQRTIIGDDSGASLYNSVEPSPLMRLVELGFDGVYLDRADVYAEIEAECPGGRAAMITFIERIAAAARKRNPGFLVILQNAEELLADARTIKVIDAAAKEDLFFGADHTEAANDAKSVAASLAHLKRAKAAGKPVFVVDYLKDKAKIADAKAKIEAAGLIPYFGPRNLGQLWLPGTDF